MLLLALVALFFAVAGLVMGMLGGGGSVLGVPILVYVAGLEPRAAIATSLLVVGVSAAIGAARQGRRNVDLRAGASLGGASMIGAFAGGRLATLLPAALLLGAFTVLMVVSALAMMRRRDESACAAPRSIARLVLVGLAVGALTGLVGAGGGFVIVPALVLFCRLPVRRAVGTSLLVIAMNATAGFVATSSCASIDPVVAGLAAAAAASGTLVGLQLAERVSPAVLRVGFAWLVLALAAFMTLEQLPGSITARMALHPYAVVLAALVGIVTAVVAVARRFAGREPRATA